jgi:hypothetical protein
MRPDRHRWVHLAWEAKSIYGTTGPPLQLGIVRGGACTTRIACPTLGPTVSPTRTMEHVPVCMHASRTYLTACASALAWPDRSRCAGMYLV